MAELLYGVVQNYAWSLKFADKLINGEARQATSKIGHQINARIYNNAFCGLLKSDYPYEQVITDGVEFLCIEFDGIIFCCPKSVAINILRSEFNTIVKDDKRESNKEALQNEPVRDGVDTQGEEGIKENIQGSVRSLQPSCNRKKNQEKNIEKRAQQISILLDDIIFSSPVRKEILEIQAIHQEKEAPLIEDFKEDCKNIDSIAKETVVAIDDSMDGHRFKPKTKNHYDSIPGADHQKSAIQEPAELRKGLFPFLGSNRNEQDHEFIDQAEAIQIKKDSTIGSDEYKSINRSTKSEAAIDGGQAIILPKKNKLFQHIHIVRLKKQFGSDEIGPYRFVFWPVQIVDNSTANGKNWAEFIAHVTDPNGNETVVCTDEKYKELIMTIDGKEFNIFATWDKTGFETHVNLRSRTASMFAIEEEVKREEPDGGSLDSYLNQFRCERKGQPKHFIVPFNNKNLGEENVPIIGYVEVDQKRYPLERREGNTLCYRYGGSEKVIRGKWKDGLFEFTVEDKNYF